MSSVLTEKSVHHSAVTQTVSIEGARILLVEDNELNREIASTLLQEEGAQVTFAENGKEAVDMIEKLSEDAFDVILMDIMMPVMDGYEATRTLRQNGVTIPIIAMTANAFAEDVQKSLDVGMNGHLSKPIEMDMVVKAIAKHLKQ